MMYDLKMFLLVILPALILPATAINIESCPQIDPQLQTPCQCEKKNNEISINCDNVVFKEDFPLLPFRLPVTEYKQRYVGLQSLTSQLFTASQIPLNKLDFSHNEIQKFSGRVFDGLENVLEWLNLQHNKLGDVHTQRLSLPELSRLAALKTLNLGYNEIQALDKHLLRNLTNLQVLQLDGNFINTVPTEEFFGLEQLKVLTLQENNLESIGEGAFHRTPNLIFLNLSRNDISTLKNRAFYQLRNLTALDLSFNRLEEIGPEVFQGLSNLEDLDLSSNFFSEIPADSFKELSILKTLRMQNNRIQTLGGIVAFGPSKTMVSLDLTRNNILNLESRTFKRLTNLRILKLSVNSIGKRKMDAFDGLSNLEILELDDHRFFSFPTEMLEMTPSLRILSLNYNRIRVITSRNLVLVNQLQKLLLSHNIIQDIPEGTFKNFTQLLHLDLSNNEISKLDETTFADVKNNLQELDLSDNMIIQLPSLDLLKLTKLKISGNRIIKVSERVFFNLPSLVEIDISHNKLKMLPTSTFERVSGLTSLDLSHNNIENVQPGLFNGSIINDIKLKGNSIKILVKNSFYNLLFLTSLDLSDNEIAVIRPGAFHDTSFLHILNLKNNKLASFSQGVFSFPRKRGSQLRFLDLSRNEITFIKDDAYSLHPKIIWLGLSHNRLNFFPRESLRSLRSISQLDLSYNEIEVVSDSDFAKSETLRDLNLSNNKIKNVSETAYQNSTQLQELNLSNNEIKELKANTFLGVFHLKLDLSNNDFTNLPDGLFDRNKMKLFSLNLSNNKFNRIPSKVLRPQYYLFNTLNMSMNGVNNIPNNADILINLKSLDLSFNPLTSNDILELLNEPKLLRKLNLAGTNIKEMPLIEARFLTSLNLSNNEISKISDKTFQLTHNLRVLDISNNNFKNTYEGFSTAWTELSNLRDLDISGNPLRSISQDGFKALIHLEKFIASDLLELKSFHPDALEGLKLKDIFIYNYPMIRLLPIQKLMRSMNGIERVDVELTQNEVDEELRNVFSPRLKYLTIRGRKVNRIKASALLHLNSPNLDLGIINTNVSYLDDRMLFLVPKSSAITLYLNNSQIEMLSNTFLDDVALPRKNRLRILGLDSNPLYCDCYMLPLRQWIITQDNSELNELMCKGPSKVKNMKISSLTSSNFTCDKKKDKNNLNMIITKDEIEQKNDRKKTVKELKTGESPLTGMDKIIIGVVGGVIGLVAFLILLVCSFRLLCDKKSRKDSHNHHGGLNGSCTCVKPGTLGYLGPYAMSVAGGSRAGTLKSMPVTNPMSPYGTLQGNANRKGYYTGPPSYLGMHYPEEEYR